MIRKAYRVFAALLSISAAGLLSLALYMQSGLPDVFYVVKGEELRISSGAGITANMPAGGAVEAYAGQDGSYTAQLRLMNTVGLKSVQVKVVERRTVVPCGIPFGIKLFTDGVMVVGMSDIESDSLLVNPAKDAGIKTGDIILEIDGKKISSNKSVGEIISASEGREVPVKIKRGSAIYNLKLKAVYSKVEERYKAGVWIRDSSAGIGTLTFFDPDTRIFGGLGHAVCDVDTGDIMPLSSGEILEANITGVNKGMSGTPGELKGIFINSNVLGKLSINSETGVFGRLSSPVEAGEAVPLAYKNEIKEGAASILATVSGNTAREYDILIERINFTDANPTKNMIIKIIDPELIRATGGIVQGMSGSPILQNGSLVGAVTHVFVNDPTRGYGIFAENMEKTSQLAAQDMKKAS